MNLTNGQTDGRTDLIESLRVIDAYLHDLSKLANYGDRNDGDNDTVGDDDNENDNDDDDDDEEDNNDGESLNFL